ncbi:hypothetical protein [Corynebacterium glutamicum]|uniref:hypothetical protein n=1 Tax=Corynebacterium glutamicum TaxID=1718 RepID=UPI000945A664|nr:hypothetical protein [Corynebacterium glutamicum]OKX83653.1 hypothetical protein AUO95_04260 [Corynebacterium glutamicum]
MKYKNENEVKKALGIESFRNLKKDDIVQFFTMLPDIDKEVRLKIIDQFPNFKEYALTAVEGFQETTKGLLNSNIQSQENLHTAWQDVRRILEAQLKNPDTTSEEKLRYAEMIMETARQESAKDSENKSFLTDFMDKSGRILGGVLMAGIVVIAGAGGMKHLKK